MRYTCILQWRTIRRFQKRCDKGTRVCIQVCFISDLCSADGLRCTVRCIRLWKMKNVLRSARCRFWRFCGFVRLRYGKPCVIRFVGWKNSVWYRIKEYYFDSRREGYQRTDEEHYAKLEELVGNRKVSRVVVDPSAASFIEVIRRHKRFNAVPAENNVVNGIRLVSQALKDGRIKICSTCKDARREFALYRWDTKTAQMCRLRRMTIQWMI